MDIDSPIPDNELSVLGTFVDAIFESEESTRLQLVEQSIEIVRFDPQISKKEELCFVLETIGNLFLGFERLKSINAEEAFQLFSTASANLERLGITELFQVASAFSVYAEAIVNLQQLNLGKTQELFSTAKVRLRQASRYGKRFEIIIDQMEPEALLIAMLEAVNQLDFQKAKVFSIQSFKAAERVAFDYYTEKDPEFHVFRGMGYLHRALYTFSQSFYDFNLFKYSDLAGRADLADDALKAVECYTRSGLNDAVVRHNHTIATAIAASLKVLSRLAEYMDGIFFAPPGKKAANTAILKELKLSAQRAADLAYEGGARSIPLARSVEILKHQIESLDSILNRPATSRPVPVNSISSGAATVFLVHGHDQATKESVARFLERLGLKVTILQETPTMGRTILEKLVDHADETTFAVVLLTPDDRGGTVATSYDAQQKRARQNVILELGYFLAILGRNRVCAIHHQSVEIPSDYHGVAYVSHDDRGAWKLILAKELKAAGINVDLNDAL